MSGKGHGKQKSGNARSETKRTGTDELNNAAATVKPLRVVQEVMEGRDAEESEADEGGHTAGETKLEIGVTAEENEGSPSSLKGAANNNPRITISGPISSPRKVVPEPQRRCPIYYGIKSYIHDFYHPPDKEILKNHDYIQEDDFRFLVEPGKRRWRNWWLRVSLWVGVNLMLLGVIALLVGHLTAPRQPVVHQQDNFTVLDRWAVTFNNRLVICQLAGLAAFTSGAVVVMLALLVSSYQSPGYYVMTATVVPESMMAAPQAGFLSSRIPLTGSIRGVQPTFVRTG